MSSHNGESQKGGDWSLSRMMAILLLIMFGVLAIGAFLIWQEVRTEGGTQEVPKLGVTVKDHEGIPVEDVIVVLTVSTDVSFDDTETVMKTTNRDGWALLRISLQNDAQLDPPHQLNVDVNNDGEYDLSADIVLLGDVWTTSEVYPWLYSVTDGFVITLAEDLMVSEDEDDESDTSSLMTTTTSEAAAEETTERSRQQRPRSPQPVRAEAVATEQERKPVFPVVETLDDRRVSFTCGDTGVSRTLESFDVRMSIAENGRIFATITVVESDINPGLADETFIFDLEENGFENSIRVDNHSLASLRSYASSMIRDIGRAELENRRTAIREARDFRCWYGGATATRSVQYSCSDGTTVSSEDVVATINRETIESTPVITDGRTADTYSLSAITVLDRRSVGRQDANNFAQAIADKVVSYRQNLAIQKLKSQCEDVLNESIDNSYDSTVDTEDDLLEGDDVLEDDTSSSGSGEPLPIVVTNRVHMYITVSGTRVDLDPFDASVMINSDLTVMAAIDQSLVPDVRSYGLPEFVEAHQATQQFANQMFSTLMTAERKKRAEAYASLHGITTMRYQSSVSTPAGGTFICSARYPFKAMFLIFSHYKVGDK